METTGFIYQKLEAFIKKFYTNELLKGIIFFVGLGLLYFLFTLFVEYFLWLKPNFRTILFFIFIGVEMFLLLRFILFPIFQLLKIKKGIGYKEASNIIGNHFTEVNDKLTNFLQLKDLVNHHPNSDLLMASIEQKANALRLVPFTNAINFKANKKYLPLALIPLFVFITFYVTGNSKIISQSLHRVVNFNSTFLPPAPFEFQLLNSKLQTEQNKDFIVKVKIKGKIVPEKSLIFIDNESYYMEKNKNDEFQFKISKPTASINFHFEANEVYSKEYELKVFAVPSISNFEMHLKFPNYLQRKSEIIKGIGNAIIPEGTQVIWKINTQATQNIDYKDQNTSNSFTKQNDAFVFSKIINQNTDYQIITSNKNINNYEKLNYQLSIVKDQYPSINVAYPPDTLKVAKQYLIGQIADDYGLNKLQIVYYDSKNPGKVKRGTLHIKGKTFDQFVFSFPSNLPVEEGVVYEYYFQIFDNDAFNDFKSTKSSVFSNKIATKEEQQIQDLESQNDNINSLSKALNNQNKQFSELDKIQKTGKETSKLEFKDQQKINDFINRQKNQDILMKEYAEKIKNNLDKINDEKKNQDKELLQKRLDDAQKDLEKNKKLLDELKDLNDKIKNEELQEKLEKFKQNSKNQVKSLKQLVELTKKYYVQKKAEQLFDRLDKLADKQNQLSEDEKKNNIEKQKEINKSFDAIQNELKDLKKENNELKKPVDIPDDIKKEQDIDDDLKKASEALQKENKENAKPKQKSAAKKMKEMADEMKKEMKSSDQNQMEEDVAMLRQILDNLLAFSFAEENNMIQFKGLKLGSPAFNKTLKTQQNLKEQFKYIDDSLFAMSLRNPKIAENITKEVGNVQYNLNKALESFSEAYISKGTSHQQYVISSTNKLADILSEVLSNMQNNLSQAGEGNPKPGKGQGQEMQLPDIIKKQKGLGDKMKEEMDKGGKQPNSENSKGEQKGGENLPGQGNKPSQGSSSGNQQGNSSSNKQGEKENQTNSSKGLQGNKKNNESLSNSQGNENLQKDSKLNDGKTGNKNDGTQGKAGNEKVGNDKNNNKEKGKNNSDEDGEGDAKKIMEIYKEQRKLRESLEKELEKKGITNGQNALNQMKDLEKQLLNKGFKNEILQKTQNIQQELLKLNTALQQQGEDSKRQSETNKKEFSNQLNTLPKTILDYLNSTEILNRESLPLQPSFNQKVQKYFNKK